MSGVTHVGHPVHEHPVDPIPGGTVGMRAESRQQPAEVGSDDFLVTRAG
jgi:hypothetical protein